MGQRGLQRLTREQLIQASSHGVNRNSAPISGNVLYEADSSGATDWPRLTSLPNISNGLFIAGIPMTSPNLPWERGLLEVKSSLGVRWGKAQGSLYLPENSYLSIACPRGSYRQSAQCRLRMGRTATAERPLHV